MSGVPALQYTPLQARIGDCMLPLRKTYEEI